MLDGIAIVQPYNAVGRGGKLISLFEQCVSALGYKNISLGSADGYVERFYIKNGYTPVEMNLSSGQRPRGIGLQYANSLHF